MPFGKHKGTLISDLPHDYLCWLAWECQDLKANIRREIEAEMDRRQKESRLQHQGE